MDLVLVLSLLNLLLPITPTSALDLDFGEWPLEDGGTGCDSIM